VAKPKPKVEPKVEPKTALEVKPAGESKEEKLRRYIESTEPEHKWDEKYEEALAAQWPDKFGKEARGKK
jgi:hypothetical protein